MITGQELLECTARLPAGKTGKENRHRKILDVPEEYDRGVLGRNIVGKLGVYLKFNEQG